MFVYRRAISGVMVAALMWTGAAVARADCVQTNAPAVNGIYECSGVDLNGLNTGGGTDTVTVLAGAVVSNAGLVGMIGAIESAGAVNVTLEAGAALNSEQEGAGGISAGGNVVLTGGLISSDDYNEIGVETDGEAILNNVTITTSGYGSEAVETNGVTTFNSGTITTSGFDAEGIHTLSFGAIMHGGTIITSNGDAEGIEAYGDVLMDGGTIITTGDGSEGIDAAGNVTVSNATISTSGGTTTGEAGFPVTSYGILASGDVNIISGGVSSTTAPAIQGTLDNQTVTIDVAAAAVNGLIDGGGGIDTLVLNGTTDDLASYNFFQNCAAFPLACAVPNAVYTVKSGPRIFKFRNFKLFTSGLTYVPGPPTPTPPPPATPVPGNPVVTNSGGSTASSSAGNPPPNDERLNPGVGDWLISIYGRNAGHPGILVYGGIDPLWIPAANLPAKGSTNQLIACTPAGDVCAYRLDSGEFQVNASIGEHRAVVIFDSLTPTHVYYGHY